MICTSHVGDSGGYPPIRRNGIRTTIARRILFKRYGKQPPSVVARHTCDRPSCINPDHIIPGSTQDNCRDRLLRGRTPTGEKNGIAKLNKHQVLKIRELYGVIPGTQLAKTFGVDQSLISRIQVGKAWKHL